MFCKKKTRQTMCRSCFVSNFRVHMQKSCEHISSRQGRISNSLYCFFHFRSFSRTLHSSLLYALYTTFQLFFLNYLFNFSKKQKRRKQKNHRFFYSVFSVQTKRFFSLCYHHHQCVCCTTTSPFCLYCFIVCRKDRNSILYYRSAPFFIKGTPASVVRGGMCCLCNPLVSKIQGCCPHV